MRTCTLETHGIGYQIQSGEKLLLLSRAQAVLDSALRKHTADIRNYERVALADMVGNCKGRQTMLPIPLQDGRCTLHFSNGDSTTVSPATVDDLSRFLADLPHKSWGSLVPRGAIQAVLAATSDCMTATAALKNQQPTLQGELIASAE